MRRRKTKVLYASVATAVIAAGAMSSHVFSRETDVIEARAVRDSGRSVERGGEVALEPGRDSVKPAWLTDAGIAALIRASSDPIIAASRLQLQSWTSDTTMNLALAILRDHGALQQSLDSLTRALRLEPVRPAIADSTVAPYEASLQKLYGLWARDLEVAFVREQRDVHTRLLTDAIALAGVARDPALQSFLTTRVIVTERAHLALVNDAAARMAKADSVRRAGNGGRE